MSAPTTRLPARLVWVTVLLSLLIGAGAGFLVGPEHQQLGTVSSGDRELAERARSAIGTGDGLRSVVVAEVTKDSIRWAGLGNVGAGRNPGVAPTESTTYELGSITKTFTGALFADAIGRGEVTADDTVSAHLPELRGSPAGSVTLGSLAQHRSGLPRMGASADSALLELLLNDNPYGAMTVERLIADAAAAPVNPEQPPTYSNLGVALLGTALVRATDAPDYRSLLAQRITGPLGMAGTTLADTDAEVPPTPAPGHAANGLPAARWTGAGYLPAGSSTFTTVTDLARWAQAQLTGRTPGVRALEPTADLGGGARIGWAWITVAPAGGPATTFHNGGTAGFRTMLALDREAGRAVVMMGNTATDLDAFALALLRGAPAQVPAPTADIIAWSVAPVALALLLGLAALRRAVRTPSLLPGINDLLASAFGLLLAWAWGPWTMVGGWLWGLALGPALAAVVLLSLRARRLSWLPERRAWLAWLGLVVALALVALGIAVL
ncbi:MAG: beta-lactamase family protein [Micropruina sp.]|nr:beta-lactamase family protein [Micropruina sp.]